VKPGITGLAQIQLPPDTDLESVRRKLAYDLYYVDQISPRLDACILLGTVTHILGLSAERNRALLGLPALDEAAPISQLELLPTTQAEVVAAA
jgi:hypothetical protein